MEAEAQNKVPPIPIFQRNSITYPGKRPRLVPSHGTAPNLYKHHPNAADQRAVTPMPASASSSDPLRHPRARRLRVSSPLSDAHVSSHDPPSAMKGSPIIPPGSTAKRFSTTPASPAAPQGLAFRREERATESQARGAVWCMRLLCAASSMPVLFVSRHFFSFPHRLPLSTLLLPYFEKSPYSLVLRGRPSSIQMQQH